MARLSMRQIGLKLLAALLILSFLTPIPGGTVFLGIGLSILVCTSEPFALFLHWLRKKYGSVDRALQWVETKLGPDRAAGLMNTRPEGDSRKHFRAPTHGPEN